MGVGRRSGSTGMNDESSAPFSTAMVTSSSPLFARACKALRSYFMLAILFFIITFSFCASQSLRLDGESKPSMAPAAGGSILGASSSLLVITYYVIFPRLRTHSNRILFYRSICDLGLACVFLSYFLRDLNPYSSFEWSGLTETGSNIPTHRTQFVALAVVYQVRVCICCASGEEYRIACPTTPFAPSSNSRTEAL